MNGHGSSGSELQPYLPSGLSHGAAGIGLALLEIHATTGRLDFREVARRLFDHEDTLFHRQKGNWAYANPSGRSPFDDTSPSFSSAWCHGGPGIALSRLRAASLDPELKEDYLDLARIAITSTLKALEEKLNDQTADATPCHGLSGLIEITWIAGQTLNDPSYRVHALEAAQALINLHSSSGDWPSGVPSGGPNPSLMIGTAGIGYTFLRLHATDRVPSVLLIRPGST